MIWFFVMGMIAGAVGVIMVIAWWAKTHMRKVTLEEMIREMKEEDKAHE